MAMHPEVSTDQTKRCQETLCLLRRLEPSHGAFPLTRGLMGVFGPIVEALMSTVVDLQLELFDGGAVAIEFVRDDDPGT
jgi:hypothetical protein